MPARHRRNPVLQTFQVEIRGDKYYVINTKTRALSAGPFKSRIKAQERADKLERSFWGA
jgi:hypothetical protein